MQDWWLTLDGFDRVVWCTGIASGLVFLIQTVATFAGMDSHGGTDIDFDGDFGSEHDDPAPFQLFTFRNLVNFLLGFSWTAIALRSLFPNLLLLTAISVLVGVLLVAAVMYLFVALAKMQQSGTMDIRRAVGKTAEIYLTVPGHRNGMGKVHVQVQGTLRELDAVTEGETIPSGALVKVTGLADDRVLVVEKTS